MARRTQSVLHQSHLQSDPGTYLSIWNSPPPGQKDRTPLHGATCCIPNSIRLPVHTDLRSGCRLGTKCHGRRLISARPQRPDSRATQHSPHHPSRSVAPPAPIRALGDATARGALVRRCRHRRLIVADGNGLYGDVLKVTNCGAEMCQRLHVLGLGRPSRHQIHRDVLGGGFQSIQRIPQMFPRASRDQDLIRSDATLTGETTSFIRSLAMTSPAITGRPSRTTRSCVLSPAPFAPLHPRYRHSDTTLHLSRPRHADFSATADGGQHRQQGDANRAGNAELEREVAEPHAVDRNVVDRL